MSSNNRQVFQTATPSRWKRFKWGTRIISAIAILLIAVLVLALIRGYNPSLPNLEAKAKIFETKLDPSNPLTISSSQNKKYKGFKDFLEQREKAHKNAHKTALKAENYIRAAFYTPWDSKGASRRALEKNCDKLNIVFPEWFFIDSTDHSKLQTRIDSAGLAIMQRAQVRILPMLTNFNSKKEDFDGDFLKEILGNTQKQQKFIKQLLDTLLHYKLHGINIDFEELPENNREKLVAFQQNLYNALHAKGLMITMDIAPKNDDYDFEALSAYNDYIVLMAYDQHFDKSNPGPVSDQKWIEEMVDWTAKRIDSKKIILGIAGYGYDWAKNENGKWDIGESLSYDEAVNRARESKAVIDFDNNNYNLHFTYAEEEIKGDSTSAKTEHEVWFTDAGTTFNILRFGDDYVTAGAALWRLGSEDERLWLFYGRELSDAALVQKPFDYSILDTISVSTTNVSYSGEGEVLNILYRPQPGKITVEIDTAEQLIAEQQYEQLPSGFIIEKFAEDSTDPGPGHKLILTFDDGPDSRWTPEILDILEREKVPGAFFVVGLQAEKNIPILQRIFKDGFEIGNHTFTHGNVAKMSPRHAGLEMKLTRLLIESVTGHSTVLFRAPYNADSEPHTYEELEPIARSRGQNYITIGEGIDPMDWEPGVSADSIFNRTVRYVEQTGASIILLHDAGGDTRAQTVKALPRIIDYFKTRGYQFTSIANLMGKTREDVMPALPPSKDSWLINFNFFLAEATYWGSQIVFALFIVGIALSVARMITVGILAYRQRKREKALAVAEAGLGVPTPLVSIIVPAYNEEVNAVRTVQSLLRQDCPNLQIIFVDDGSADTTFQKVSAAFENNPAVKVFTKPNGGKASALNYGIGLSEAEFVVCIDADTQLKQDAVSQLMRKFFTQPVYKTKNGAQVGAVAGNVKVGNEVNMITKWQSIEYITAQNFDRRAFDLLNCITVVPGAIGAFRREAIVNAGMFTTDTLAEDCDLTVRLLKSGYIIRNCTEAISYTEAPESLKGFLKQRFRWSFGVMQTFWKHMDACFNPRYKALGMVALPNILIFQILLPFLAPLADLVLLVSLIAAGFHILPADISSILIYYGVFMLVDVAGAAIAFVFEKEDHKKLIWMIPQRLVYRQLMYYILVKSFIKAMKGELQGWGKLKRTGNVNENISFT
ncbi:MAG: polysaccharide deacetylase family protein [Agriterribacter sp.]